MRPCTGCKHLVNAGRYGFVCSADDPPPKRVDDPYTGSVRWVPQRRPRPADMRAEGAKCGPDAAMWLPNVWRKPWMALRRK